jgi:hypothetical protein
MRLWCYDGMRERMLQDNKKKLIHYPGVGYLSSNHKNETFRKNMYLLFPTKDYFCNLKILWNKNRWLPIAYHIPTYYYSVECFN